jgi:hypothetical protein
VSAWSISASNSPSASKLSSLRNVLSNIWSRFRRLGVGGTGVELGRPNTPDRLTGDDTASALFSR